MQPQEILEKGIPYIKVGDQFIVTENWPKKNCKKCKQMGYFGILALTKKAKSYKPQPNSKCPCNSNKKYKVCCRDKIERLSQGGGKILVCPCVGKATLAENEFISDLRKEMILRQVGRQNSQHITLPAS